MTAEALRFKQLIAKAATGALLDQDEAGDAFAVMMEGGATPSQIAGFLMALRVRGGSRCLKIGWRRRRRLNRR